LIFATRLTPRIGVRQATSRRAHGFRSAWFNSICEMTIGKYRTIRHRTNMPLATRPSVPPRTGGQCEDATPTPGAASFFVSSSKRAWREFAQLRGHILAVGALISEARMGRTAAGNRLLAWRDRGRSTECWAILLIEGKIDRAAVSPHNLETAE
jgi:hypothetical protein